MKFAARHAADRHRNRRWSRTKRWRLLAGGGLLSALLAAALSIGTFAGSDFASAAIERAKSFVDLIQQRSPGRRTQAQLTKLKHKAVSDKRVLPKLPIALPMAFPEEPVPLIDLISPPVHPAGLESLPPPPLIEQPSFPPMVFNNKPPTILLSPVETPTAVPPSVPPPSAVPEPGTWASMLLGFGLIGWTMRRRRKQVRGDAL